MDSLIYWIIHTISFRYERNVMIYIDTIGEVVQKSYEIPILGSENTRFAWWSRETRLEFVWPRFDFYEMSQSHWIPVIIRRFSFNIACCCYTNCMQQNRLIFNHFNAHHCTTDAISKSNFPPTLHSRLENKIKFKRLRQLHDFASPEMRTKLNELLINESSGSDK